MAVDYFPNKDGYIEDGHVVGFCYADDVVMTAGAFVTWGASRANYVAVKASDLACDAVGMCLRTPAAVGDIVPVAFKGIVKAAVHSTIAIGDLVGNSSTTITALIPVFDAYASNLLFHNSSLYTAKILGMALQAGAVPKDEILIMINKIC